jgi:hypothetical protein
VRLVTAVAEFYSLAVIGARMKTRRFIVYVASAIAVAIIVCVTLTTCWQRKQPSFKDAPKLVAAIQAFSGDLTVRGQSLPATVSLRELVSGGYIAASDVRAFDGMDVTISLTSDESHPQEILIRVRLPDGSVTAAMADGSVQGLRQ